MTDLPHIGIYGRTNSGKSSLLNFLTGQQSALVSAQAGTTTDPVRRRFELAGIGPVLLIDTPGWDDDSELGALRGQTMRQTLDEIDLALVVGATTPDFETALRRRAIPWLVIENPDGKPFEGRSAAELLAQIAAKLQQSSMPPRPFFGNRLHAGDSLLLVCPIDRGAPAGRLILPQVQALRAALDLHAVPTILQPAQAAEWLQHHRPRLIVADSQCLAEVTAIAPPGVEVTSFSILLAELKGDPELYRAGLHAVDRLRGGDRVLVLESCSHHPSCDDIGRSKIPAWLEQYTGQRLEFDFVGGRDPLPELLEGYALAVQCGGCMAPARLLRNRLEQLKAAGVPTTNYGMLIQKIRKSQ